MDDHSTDPHDAKVRTVPLPADDAGGGERVIAQENQSPEVALGSGEWPSTEAPPTGPAPGTAAGDDGVASEAEPARFPPVRDVLEADAVAGGSRSVPDEDADATGGTRFS